MLSSLLLPFALWGTPAHALDVGWLVGGGVEYSDNISREAEGEEESDWVRDVRTGVTLSEETTRFDASFDGLLLLEDYANNTFDDGAVFEGAGALDLALVPHRLTWVVRDSFQQVPQSNRAAATRGNEQNTNAFVTGPDLELPLGSVTFLRLSARYGDFYFEDTDEDHTREVGQAGLARRLSPVSEASVNVRSEEVVFDEEGGFREDFVTDSAFVRYDRRVAGDGRVTLDVGGFEVERDRLADLDGALGRLSARRGLGATAAAGFQVGHGPTDVGTTLSGVRDDPLSADTRSVTVTGDVGEQSTARAFYTQEFGRLALNLSGGASEEDYLEADELDRDRVYAAIGLDYRTTPQRTIFAEAGRSRVDYVIDEPTGDSDRYGDYDDYVYTLGFDQRLGRALTLTGAVSQDRRRSYGQGHDYEENLLRVTLVYGFGHPDVIGENELADEDV